MQTKIHKLEYNLLKTQEKNVGAKYKQRKSKERNLSVFLS